MSSSDINTHTHTHTHTHTTDLAMEAQRFALRQKQIEESTNTPALVVGLYLGHRVVSMEVSDYW